MQKNELIYMWLQCSPIQQVFVKFFLDLHYWFEKWQYICDHNYEKSHTFFYNYGIIVSNQKFFTYTHEKKST